MVIALQSKVPTGDDEHLNGASDRQPLLLPPIPPGWEEPEPELPAVDGEAAPQQPAGDTGVRESGLEGERAAVHSQSPMARPDAPDELTDLTLTDESWFKSEERTRKARDELQTLLEGRDKAAELRETAGQVFDDGRAISEEASRVRDTLLRALDWKTAAGPREYATWAAAVRRLDEVSRSHAVLRRSSQQEAWEEARRTMLKASRELLKALNAVSVVRGQVERELKEARNLLTVSESALGLAHDELNSARAVAEKLFQEEWHSHGLREPVPSARLADRADAPYDAVRIAEDQASTTWESGPAGDPDEWSSASSSLSDVEQPGTYDCSDAETEEWDETPDMPGAPDENEQGAQDSYDPATGPSDTPGISGVPASDEILVTKVRGRSQGLFRKSSDLVKEITGISGANGAPKLSKEWDVLATGIIPASATYLQRARQLADEPAPLTGAVSLPPSQPAVQGVPEVSEDALKEQLASLRRSLEDFRVAQYTPPAAVPTVSTASQPSASLTGQQQDWTPEVRPPSGTNGFDVAVSGQVVFPEPANGHNGNGAESAPRELIEPSSHSLGESAGANASPIQPSEPVEKQTPAPQDVGVPADPEHDPLYETVPNTYRFGSLDTTQLPAPGGQEEHFGGTVDAPPQHHAEERSSTETSSEASGGLADGDLPATFSGRVSLVFTPCPDAEKLGSFWEVVEAVAGAGAMADARPLDSGNGFEFLLDLSDELPVVERLKGGIPEAEITSLGDNGLSIQWSGAAGKSSGAPDAETLPAVVPPPVQPGSVPVEEWSIPAGGGGEDHGLPHRQSSEVPNQAAEPGPASTDLPETFSGRLSVVFVPCPDADRLGSFWESLDEVAGVGAIVDARPQDEGSGFEFVLDLGQGQMSVEQLKGRIPDTEMTAKGDAELIIRW